MKALFLLLLGIVINPILFAQSNRWENITNTNMVTSLYNDGDTLWVGTFGGLIKYNKKTGDYFCYNKANSGLPSNNITDITMDSKQNIWLTTYYNGIACFSNGTCKIYNQFSNNGLRDIWADDIYIDNNDTVFFGPNTQFNRIKNNELKTIPLGNPIMSIPQVVNDIIPAKEGGLIVATTIGLYKYKNGVFSLLMDEGNPGNCNALAYDSKGTLWIATYAKGLCKYANDTVICYNQTNSQLSSYVNDIAIDKNDNIWLAAGGLIKFTESGCDIYKTEKNDGILSILNDDTCIWVGTTYNGLMRFSDGKFHKVQIASSNLSTNNYRRLNVFDNKVLINHTSSIARFDGQTIEVIADTTSGLQTYPINALYPYKNKGIFIVGDKTKLCYYENGTYRYYNNFEADNVRDIAPLSPDTFWVSTSTRGLLKYQNGEITEYNITNSLLPSNNLYALKFDKNGLLWGSCGSGSTTAIFSFDGTNWKIWSKTNVPYLSYAPTSMVFDTKNHLWCNGGNLIRFDGVNWTQYNHTNSPLPSLNYWNVYADPTDTIWITTDYEGAFKFDRKDKWEVYNIYNSGIASNKVFDIVRAANGDVYFLQDRAAFSILKNSINSGIYKTTFKEFDDLIVYPNPTQDIITIQIPANSSTFSIEIIDIVGKLLFNSTWRNGSGKIDKQQINLSSFEKGIYIVRLNTDKESYSKKITIK